MTSKKIFIVSGEASGDLHGSNLIKSLKKKNPELIIEGWGGDLMEEAGMTLHKHYKDLAFMGFIEVIKNIRTILGNFKICKRQIQQFSPDAVIFIDYPGFNLRMAKFVKGLGIKSIYYISPQIWAWKQSRVKTIKQYVDEMITILPFETEFYNKFNHPVSYVGHPLLDEIKLHEETDSFRSRNGLTDQPIIALLPGSRTQEISRMLKIMIEAGNNFPEYQLVIAGAPGKSLSDYESYITDKTKIVFNQTYDLFKSAKAGWITSGTATLEAAIHKLPQIVVYKANSLSYWIAKQLIKVKFISLVNLIMDKEIVKEMIQADANPTSLTKEMNHVLSKEGMDRILSDYVYLEEKLGGKGASEKAANIVLKTIK